MANNNVTLTGQLPGAAGATAIFTPSNWLTDATNKLLFPPSSVTKTLDGSGKFSVSLLATDNGAPLPAGWTWTVEFIGVQGVAEYSFSFFLAFANGATQDISTLAVLSPVPAVLTYLPLPGGSPQAGQVPIATGTGEASTWGSPGANPLPADFAFQAWTMDPASSNSTVTPVSGTIYLSMFFMRTPGTLASVVTQVPTTPGSGLVAGQSLIGIYDTAGSLKAVTADLSGVLNSTGLKQIAFTSPYSAPAGRYFVAFLSVGTTMPTMRSSASAAGMPNANLSAANLRFAVAAASQTTLPSTLTPASYTATGAFPFTFVLY